jgi:hypothetical protein
MLASDKKFDFFLAHAAKDRARAEELYELLQPKSRVFLDVRTLSDGTEWDRQIPEAQRSSSITVVLVSAHSADAYYQREEVATAVELSRFDRSGHGVVPVYLDGIPTVRDWNFYGLRIRQGIDALRVGGLPRVAEQLLGVLGGEELRPPESQHPLHLFPRGPLVEEYYVPSSLIQAYWKRYQNLLQSLAVIADANAFRREADPIDASVTFIDTGALPQGPQAAPADFWYGAFTEARLNSPRMLAALVLVVPDGGFTKDVQLKREKLLDELSNM